MWFQFPFHFLWRFSSSGEEVSSTAFCGTTGEALRVFRVYLSTQSDEEIMDDKREEKNVTLLIGKLFQESNSASHF